MILIGEEWGKTYRGTKIFIKEDYYYIGFENKKTFVPKGYYFITGFWCDAMGLNSENANGLNQFVCPSKALMYFYKARGAE